MTMYTRFCAGILLCHAACADVQPDTDELVAESTLSPTDAQDSTSLAQQGDAGTPEYPENDLSVEAVRIGEERKHPPPVQVLHDATKVQADIEFGEAAEAARSDPHQRLNAFLGDAVAYTVVLAEYESEAGVSSDGNTSYSNWQAIETLAGVEVPSQFTLAQHAMFGEIPECGGVHGAVGRPDILLVTQQGDGNYVVLRDNQGRNGHFLKAGEKYQLDRGPFFDGAALLQEAATW